MRESVCVCVCVRACVRACDVRVCVHQSSNAENTEFPQ